MFKSITCKTCAYNKTPSDKLYSYCNHEEIVSWWRYEDRNWLERLAIRYLLRNQPITAEVDITYSVPIFNIAAHTCPTWKQRKSTDG